MGGVFMEKKNSKTLWDILPSMVLDTISTETMPLGSYQCEEREVLINRMYDGKIILGYKLSVKKYKEKL